MTEERPAMTPDKKAAREANRARYREKNGDRIRQKRQEARAAINAMPTLPLVQWAQINSPASVWAYAARSAS